jgi:hypothetical protein
VLEEIYKEDLGIAEFRNSGINSSIPQFLNLAGVNNEF